MAVDVWWKLEGDHFKLCEICECFTRNKSSWSYESYKLRLGEKVLVLGLKTLIGGVGDQYASAGSQIICPVEWGISSMMAIDDIT
jgi:hypothetical protein